MTKKNAGNFPLLRYGGLILLVVAAAACIARFDPVALQQATSLKLECLIVMDQATDPYAGREAQIDALLFRMEKAYEYAKSKPKNEICARQWYLLKDPDRNMVGGFFKRWKERGQLSEAFVAEAKKVVVAGFDQLVELEKSKKARRRYSKNQKE